RRWKVASRTHPVPELVEIAPQVGIKLLDRLSINTGRARFGFDRFVRFVHLLLSNIERFVRRINLHLPVSSCFDHTTAWPDPFAPSPLQGLHHYCGSVRPSAPLRYSRLAIFVACASPFPSEHWFLQFRTKACIRLTPPLRRSPSAQSSGTRQTYPRRDSRSWF